MFLSSGYLLVLNIYIYIYIGSAMKSQIRESIILGIQYLNNESNHLFHKLHFLFFGCTLQEGQSLNQEIICILNLLGNVQCI